MPFFLGHHVWLIVGIMFGFGLNTSFFPRLKLTNEITDAILMLSARQQACRHYRFGEHRLTDCKEA